VWERWRIPFRVAVDLNKTVVEGLRKDLQSSPGFYEQNLNGAAAWCLQHNINLEEALSWTDNAINMAPTFTNHQLKSRILEKLGKTAEAEKTMTAALDKANVQELHQYGRQLITDKKPAKAMEIFQMNYKKNGDTWPTHVGLMRGYSATGDVKKALEHAQIAVKQAPDDMNRKNLEGYVKTLSEGKALVQ
jgi:tetratricopeptide (TPR) repeat protein